MAWLDSYGLSEDHQIAVSWTECSPVETSVYVHGFRLAPVNGGEMHDVYFNEEGLLLSDEELTLLGIEPKQWNYSDIDVLGSVSSVPVPEKREAKKPSFSLNPNNMRHILSPVNTALLLEEDALRESQTTDSLFRYGINRALESPVILENAFSDNGMLTRTEDGQWQWEWALQACGALGVRLCLESLEIPEGVELYVVNVEHVEEYYGPFSSSEILWTPTLLAETVGIVCMGETEAQLTDTHVEVRQIIHVYRSPLDSAEKLGNCHVDLMCYPDWEITASAIGRLALVNYDAWSCTGALVAAVGYEDNPPFLLTANHCIHLQAEASTLEVWWYYHRSECNTGSIPALSSLPRSKGGAKLLVSADATSGSDFTLLLLQEKPPTSTAYLGYTTRGLEADEEVACIHHPEGTEKRISFGAIAFNGSPVLDNEPLAPYEYYHEVSWNEGTTEPGSSGAPLLLLSTMQILGQLYGGYASCEQPEEPDYFGRIDVTYPLIYPWLSGEQPLDEGEGEEEGEGEGEGEGKLEGEKSPPDEQPGGCCARLCALFSKDKAKQMDTATSNTGFLFPLSALLMASALFRR